MAEPFLGEIKLVPYNFAPVGWAFCAGQLMAIDQNTALFALVGTTYGGDGQTTFGLPDLRGRAPVHTSGSFPMGMMDGTEAVTLLSSQIPQHTHQLHVSSVAGTDADPTAHFLGASGSKTLGKAYADTSDGTMNPTAVGLSGGSQPHENMQPFLVMNYIIALEGIFPSHN